MRASAVLPQQRDSIPADANSVTVEIGGIPIRLRVSEPDLATAIGQRYAGFLSHDAPSAAYEFDLLLEPAPAMRDGDIHVSKHGSVWRLRRGDFRAQWDSVTRRGFVRQPPSPYSTDAVLRIVHTLALAEQRGFLLHASSVVRNDRAFVFAGLSGAGKTTIARLAPPDATLLTDEISYIKPHAACYRAYGTPFAGELGKPGENISAPIATLYLLEKGSENRIEPVDPLTATRSLLRHVLFFANDRVLVQHVFDAAFEFVSRVMVAKLIFALDPSVWEHIR